MKLEIIIGDQEELRYFRQTLLETIHELSQSEDLFALEESKQDSIYWLSKILLLSYHQH